MKVTRPAAALMSAIDPWYTGPIVPVLQRRRSDLAARLEGDVLILTGPPAAWPGHLDQTSSYDEIATVGWLAAAPDLDAAIADLVARLSPGGWLHSIEPTSGPTPVARAQRLAAPVGRLRTGWHLGRDIPAALRRGGLVVTDVERFTMPLSSTILRPWVQTRARVRDTGGAPVAAEDTP